MQRIVEVLCLDDRGLATESISWLRLGLFGDTAPGLTKKAIGQFSPGQAGGPNATTGFEADATINPWDFVLMIEGALPFAAAVVRRNADDPSGVLSYPFTVTSVAAGSGNLGEGDFANARGELWMPLWDRPASYAEVSALLSEGRVALGRKPAGDALDFVRAIHHLGGYRGVRSFQRYSLLMRSGKAYLATPVERIEVADEPRANLLDELDHRNWLHKFRAFAQSDSATNRLRSLRRRLENAFFDFSGKELSPEDTQAILALLAEIQFTLARCSKSREEVDPVPRLSGEWVERANDHTSAFRVARALAGLRGSEKFPLPLQAQLFPVHPRFSNKWVDNAEMTTNDPASRVRIYTGMSTRLSHTLRNLLDRRLRLAQSLEMKDKPLDSAAGATLSDVADFLQNDSIDLRIAALLPGLSLCSTPEVSERLSGNISLPAAFGLLKLCFAPESILRSLQVLRREKSVPVSASILAQLASGHKAERAVLTAWRRLHASGLKPVFSPDSLPSVSGVPPQRLAGALLIPLHHSEYEKLARAVLKRAAD
jgi:CRISPR-associated protein Csx17